MRGGLAMRSQCGRLPRGGRAQTAAPPRDRRRRPHGGRDGRGRPADWRHADSAARTARCSSCTRSSGSDSSTASLRQFVAEAQRAAVEREQADLHRRRHDIGQSTAVLGGTSSISARAGTTETRSTTWRTSAGNRARLPRIASRTLGRHPARRASRSTSVTKNALPPVSAKTASGRVCAAGHACHCVERQRLQVDAMRGAGRQFAEQPVQRVIGADLVSAPGERRSALPAAGCAGRRIAADPASPRRPSARPRRRRPSAVCVRAMPATNAAKT